MHVCSHLVLNKGTKNIYWRKRALLANGAGGTGYLQQRTETRYKSFTLYRNQFKNGVKT
jgi:hypothetical protein